MTHFLFLFWLYWTLPAAFYMQRRFRAIHKKPHIKNCQYNKKDFTYFMLFHCTSPDSFLFHTYTIQSQSQFNLNKIYFSCSNQIYADSHNRLSCLERLLRQFIDHCSVLPILFSLCFLSCVGGLTHGIPFLLYIRYPPSFLFELLDNLSKSCFLVLCP